jgi:hypothetical protein
VNLIRVGYIAVIHQTKIEISVYMPLVKMAKQNTHLGYHNNLR